MKALVMAKYGGPNVVSLREVPAPKPQPNEVVVEVVAAGLNPVDRKIRSGGFRVLVSYRLPAVMGNELAGRVVEVGSAVTRFKVGDEVFGQVRVERLGALAERCAIPEEQLCLKPPNLSFEEAASLPLVATTVRHALVDVAKVQPGQKVFVKAGSGGVGTFAIQFAKTLGAYVATTTSTANVEWVRALGADQVIDYTHQAFESVLSGFDTALDSVDGNRASRAFSILNRGGHLIAIAGPPDAAFAKSRRLNVALQWAFAFLSRRETRAAKAAGVQYTFFLVRPSGAALAEVAALVQAGKIKPVVDRVFPFAEAREALAYLDRGRARGKVVVKM